jgi:hypothetical protein
VVSATEGEGMGLKIGTGVAVPSGDVTLGVLRPWPKVADLMVHSGVEFGPGERRRRLAELDRVAAPQMGLSREVNDWRRQNWPKVRDQFTRINAALDVWPLVFYGSLFLRVFRATGRVDDFGLASLGLVTTAGVNYLVADMDGGANDINLFKFHGIGTGTTAEAVGDTALVTEITTAYATDNTRPTGTQTTGGSSNIYRTVGTIVVDAAVVNTEHGIFTQAATGGGTLWDRSQYAAVNLASGDTLQAQYDATFPAGG